MFVEFIGMLLLFPRSDFNNPMLENSESGEKILGNHRKFERDFTVESLLQIEDMNWRKNGAMYKIYLKKNQYENRSGCQATYGEFVKQAASKFDTYHP